MFKKTSNVKNVAQLKLLEKVLDVLKLDLNVIPVTPGSLSTEVTKLVKNNFLNNIWMVLLLDL